MEGGALKRVTLLLWLALTAVLLALPAGAGAVQNASATTSDMQFRVLVLTEGASGDVHGAYRAIEKAGAGLYQTDELRKNSEVKFTDKQLARYRAVVFLNTAGDVLNADEQAAFERYFSGGGGFVGIGSAIDTLQGWQFLTDILGARTFTTLAAPSVAGGNNVKVPVTTGLTVGSLVTLDSGANSESARILTVGTAGPTGGGITFDAPLTKDHALGSQLALPQADVQSATIKVADRVHDASKSLPQYWNRTDDWINVTPNVRGVSHVLATVVEDPFGPQPQGQVLDGIAGGTMGADHPVSWCKDYKGGRSFYTALGNTRESFDEGLFRTHLVGAIGWAAGVADKTYSDCGELPAGQAQRAAEPARADRVRPVPGRSDHPDRPHRHRPPARPGGRDNDGPRQLRRPERAADAADLHEQRGRDVRPGDRQQLRHEQVGLPLLLAADGRGREAVGRLDRHADHADDGLAGHRGVEDRVGSVGGLLPALALQVRGGHRDHAGAPRPVVGAADPEGHEQPPGVLPRRG
jgi:hypothetical protein